MNQTPVRGFGCDQPGSHTGRKDLVSRVATEQRAPSEGFSVTQRDGAEEQGINVLGSSG